MEFINENIVGWTLIFSIPLWCLGSCLLHWLVSWLSLSDPKLHWIHMFTSQVDYPRQKAFERSVENQDMGKLFVRPRRPIRVQPMERRELLAGTESPEPESPVDEPIDEPVDDLPPPRSYI